MIKRFLGLMLITVALFTSAQAAERSLIRTNAIDLKQDNKRNVSIIGSPGAVAPYSLVTVCDDPCGLSFVASANATPDGSFNIDTRTKELYGIYIVAKEAYSPASITVQKINTYE